MDVNFISRVFEVMLRGGREVDVGKSMIGFCFYNIFFSV